VAFLNRLSDYQLIKTSHASVRKTYIAMLLYFKVLRQKLNGEIEENHEKLESILSASGLRNLISPLVIIYLMTYSISHIKIYVVK
jgi:hypothetical protein